MTQIAMTDSELSRPIFFKKCFHLKIIWGTDFLSQLSYFITTFTQCRQSLLNDNWDQQPPLLSDIFVHEISCDHAAINITLAAIIKQIIYGHQGRHHITATCDFIASFSINSVSQKSAVKCRYDNCVTAGMLR